MLNDQDIFNRYKTKQIQFKKRANVTLIGHSLFDMWEGFEKTLTLKGLSVANLGISGTSTRQYLDVIVKPQHIQHLGYQGNNKEESNFELFEKDNQRFALNSQCLIFFYDLNGDGCLGKRATKKALCRNGKLNNTKDLAKEVFGFKLEEKEIHLYADNRFENCLGEQCKTLLDSCGNKWTKFTSKEEYLVDKLQFNWKKQNELMQIDLTLSSIKDKKIKRTEVK